MASMTEEQILAEAERRYLYDAEFHAVVEMTVHALAFDLQTKTGGRMTPADRTLAVRAAAVALVMTEET